MNLRAGILFCASLVATAASAADADKTRWSTLGPAAQVPNAVAAPVLAAAKAGSRTVVVGDHGVILLSGDDGLHFRQAKTVPVRSLLTAVQFVDARRGFAAGHDGVVLGTQDGGDTWTLLHAMPGVEKPILSLHFDSAEHGLAVGLYGWTLETSDGGHSWTEGHIGGDGDDRHLFHLFTSPKGTWLIAAEQGTVFRSTDGGKSWQALSTGDQGSLWHGTALADGTLLVCGMRGHIYRSTDDGQSWQAVASGTTQSLTSIAQMPDRTVVIVGLSGALLRSKDSGITFSVTQLERGEPLTDIVANGEKPLLMSMAGVLR